MEYYEQIIVIGIRKNLFVKLHCRLLVSTEKVNLYSK